MHSGPAAPTDVGLDYAFGKAAFAYVVKVTGDMGSINVNSAIFTVALVGGAAVSLS